MMKEIKGYPGYQVNENGVVINKKGHMMRYGMNDAHRIRVALETYDENGKLIERKNKSISRLVAEAFIPNPDNLPVVMHIDNDPLHNHVSNLKWGTQSENIHQAFDEGRKYSKGNTSTKVYKVTNGEESILCAGYKGVADLIGYTNPNSIRPGLDICIGEYTGYTVESTDMKARRPVIFDNDLLR